MKKIIVCICILFFMVGCKENKAVSQNKKMYFLFATPLAEHQIWLQAKDGFDAACKENDIHCDWIGPTAIDTLEMEEVIETGIMQKADAIITQGVVSESLIAKAAKNGIPIILVDSDMKDSGRLSYLGKDFEEQANLFLEDMEKKLGKDVLLKIAIQVAEKDFTIATDQIAQLEKAFAKHPGGFEIVSISESKSDSVRAKKEWKNDLTLNDINVAINFAGESAISCNEVAQEQGKRDSMLIYGVDDMPDTIDLIEKNQIDGSIVTSFYNYGYQSVNWMYEYVKTGKTSHEGINSIKLMLVTNENVANYKGALK